MPFDIEKCRQIEEIFKKFLLNRAETILRLKIDEIRRLEMAEQIYELVWKLRCLDLEFVRTEWKVFESETKAKAYGRQQQDELNDNLPPYEKADDSYYFEFMAAYPMAKVDGHRVLLIGDGV